MTEPLDELPTYLHAPSSEEDGGTPDLDHGATLRGLRAGLKVFGRYTLLRKLGQGGMGVVWLADDKKLDMRCALKFLPDHFVHDELALDDLRRETRRCLRLHHTNIVHVQDLVDDEATAAIVMEFVDGKTLSALRQERPGRAFEVADITPWMGQVCEALEHAHGTARIVHHDLKPGNLMLDGNGVIKVMDFGISRSLEEGLSRVSLAEQGSSGGGTLPYMSPQQLVGAPPSVADDVYSLGATIYELLTGKPPFFRGNLPHQIESVVPPPLAERRRELGVESTAPLPAAWEEVTAACLRKEPDRRPRSAREVWDRLNAKGALAPEPTPARMALPEGAEEPPDLTRSLSPAQRGRSMQVLQVIMLVLGLGFSVWLGWVILKRPATGAVAAQSGDAVPPEMSPFEPPPIVAEAPSRTAPRAAEKAAASTVQALNAASLKTGKIGDTQKVDLGGGVSLMLCLVPEGESVVSSSYPPREVPVLLSQSFWLAQTECTQKQWEHLLGYSLSEAKGSELPMENVSWDNAQMFVAKLSLVNPPPEGWQWSLPTEAQWEHACRAGTIISDPLESKWAGDAHAWHADNSDRKTHPVGTKEPNPWGLHDLFGNVGEWCLDWHMEKLQGGTDPMGPLSGFQRVIRGNAFMTVLWRSSELPGYRNEHTGFRVALVRSGR